MPTKEQWKLINEKSEELTRLVQASGLTMVNAQFGTNDNINNWNYKIWINKKDQKK